MVPNQVAVQHVLLADDTACPWQTMQTMLISKHARE
jgi:hypothetical protein